MVEATVQSRNAIADPKFQAMLAPVLRRGPYIVQLKPLSGWSPADPLGREQTAIVNPEEGVPIEGRLGRARARVRAAGAYSLDEHAVTGLAMWFEIRCGDPVISDVCIRHCVLASRSHPHSIDARVV
jgi:hypothetical protein